MITYRPRSAIRDVGKALGLSLDRIDKLAKSVEHFHEEPNMAEQLAASRASIRIRHSGNNSSTWLASWSVFPGTFPSTPAAW